VRLGQGGVGAQGDEGVECASDALRAVEAAQGQCLGLDLVGFPAVRRGYIGRKVRSSVMVWRSLDHALAAGNDIGRGRASLDILDGWKGDVGIDLRQGPLGAH
jgi:hypothetical protein